MSFSSFFSRAKIKWVLLIVILIANVVVWTYRLTRREDRVFFGKSETQVFRLKSFDQMKRLPVSKDSIGTFIDSMFSSNADHAIPPEVQLVSFEQLNPEEQADIKTALLGFFEAYSLSSPASVYRYMTVNRGETMDDTMFNEMKKIIKEVDRSSAVTNPEEAFSFLWKLHNCGVNWAALLEGSACICFWETDKPLTKSQFLILNSLDESLFSNRSTFNHLFTSNVSYYELLQKKTAVRFADVFFVVELTSDFDNGFLPISIRFWYNRESKKWIPERLDVVRTDSFDIPSLLF